MTNEQIAQLAAAVAGQVLEDHVSKVNKLDDDSIAHIANVSVRVARAIAQAAEA